MNNKINMKEVRGDKTEHLKLLLLVRSAHMT